MCNSLNMSALIQDCLATLTRLPGLTVDYELEVGQRHGRRADAMVTIRTAAGTDRYAAEAKAHVTSQSLSSLLSHLTQLQRAGGARAMLLTMHAPPAVADALAAHGIAYADAAGNVHLNGPAAYALIRGQRPERTATRSGLTTTDLHLVFALLRRTDLLRAPLRQVAEATGVSLGKVSTTIRTLSELGFVQAQGRRRQLRDPERLLGRWEVGYLEVVRPRLHPSTWRIPPGTTLDDLRRRALELPDVLIGGEFAADALTQSLRPGSLTLHTAPGGTKRLAVDLRLRPSDSAEPEVTLVERFLTGLDQADAKAHANGATGIAHPILARAELLALGSDRLREIADRIRDDIILPGLRDDT
jgi:hypothetical protein